MVGQMKPPSILRMDFRLMPISRTRVDVTQDFRISEFLQATRETAYQADFKRVQATVRVSFMFSMFISRMLVW